MRSSSAQNVPTNAKVGHLYHNYGCLPDERCKNTYFFKGSFIVVVWLYSKNVKPDGDGAKHLTPRALSLWRLS